MKARRGIVGLLAALALCCGCSASSVGGSSGSSTSSGGTTATSSSGSGAGSSTTSGSSSSSSSSSSGSAVTCSPDAGAGNRIGYGQTGLSIAPSFPTEFEPCSSDSDCTCPLRCIHDAALATYYGSSGACEQPCASASDCADPLTTCRAGACGFNYCDQDIDGADAGSVFGGSCKALNGNDGTCQVVYQNDNYPIIFGVCVQAGTATATCTVGATRNTPAQLCVQGSLCLGNAYDGCQGTAGDGGATFCTQVCNALANSVQCPVGQTCHAWAPEPPQGVCGPPPGSSFGICR